MDGIIQFSAEKKFLVCEDTFLFRVVLAFQSENSDDYIGWSGRRGGGVSGVME